MIVWIADSAAYFAGRAFGKHKLAPFISPGKSWEGVVGAMLVVSLYAFIMGYFFLSFSPLTLISGACLLTAISIVGDLLESLFKRQIGIKNSSNLLPGHGGVLDRVDSLLALLPFIGLLLIWT
jgi:phosphatidate cytidylyltransferase